MQSANNYISALACLNFKLAKELSKLPEITTLETPSACRALKNFLMVYQMVPDSMDKIFNQINTIGLPAQRIYCTPLQALFWLFQDEKIDDAGVLFGIDIRNTTDEFGHWMPEQHSPVTLLPEFANEHVENGIDHIIKKILDSAWKRETVLIAPALIHKIIQRIRTKTEKEEYALLVRRHDNAQLQGYIIEDFLTKKDIFDTSDWQTLENAVQHSRWKQFFTVADRLNAPRLISYYIENYLKFRKTPAHGVYMTFFQSRAQCTDAAYFAEYMLNRAGYKTFMRSVKWDEDPWDGLHTGAGIIRDDGSYQLVSNFTGINSLSGGPYKDTDALDEKLSCGRKIINRRWGAFYPPRHY